MLLKTGEKSGFFVGHTEAICTGYLAGNNAARLKLTFAGSIYFNRMKELGFYTIDRKEVEERVRKAGLEGVFNKNIIK